MTGSYLNSLKHRICLTKESNESYVCVEKKVTVDFLQTIGLVLLFTRVFTERSSHAKCLYGVSKDEVRLEQTI